MQVAMVAEVEAEVAMVVAVVGVLTTTVVTTVVVVVLTEKCIAVDGTIAAIAHELYRVWEVKPTAKRRIDLCCRWDRVYLLIEKTQYFVNGRHRATSKLAFYLNKFSASSVL
jgi:hypothetical protein